MSLGEVGEAVAESPVGAVGGVGAEVCPEYADGPEAFSARTRKKYVVLGDRLPWLSDVPPALTVVAGENALLVEYCNSYPVRVPVPPGADHDKSIWVMPVGGPGTEADGVPGASGRVRPVTSLEYPEAPPELKARTRKPYELLAASPVDV